MELDSFKNYNMDEVKALICYTAILIQVYDFHFIFKQNNFPEERNHVTLNFKKAYFVVTIRIELKLTMLQIIFIGNTINFITF